MVGFSDTRKRTRKSGKSMSRRSGQNPKPQIHGKWYVVRYWIDVPGQEKRERAVGKICPISGPDLLSASERKRKVKEIVAASGADSVEHFEKVVLSLHGATFREQAAVWLDRVRSRRRKPVAPSTIQNWESALDNWINPHIGDMPLDAVNNLAMKNLVAKMVVSGELAPKSIGNYTQIVKMVVASAVNEQGEEVYPRKWNPEFIDMPEVKKQKQPCFVGEVVTNIVAAPRKKHYRMLYILLAASGLRFGEALGIDIKNFSPDFTTLNVCQKAWRGKIHDFLKTDNARRQIDLHPTVAAMLKEFVGERTSGLLFQSRNGKPLSQSNILRRSLHPILANINHQKCGAHAFRRFRNTYLRNHTSTPPGLRKFWMGWNGDPADAVDARFDTGKEMEDLYDKVREDARFRREVTERAGLGFEIPSLVPPKKSKRSVIGPNGPKTEVEVVHALAVNC